LHADGTAQFMRRGHTDMEKSAAWLTVNAALGRGRAH